MTFHKVMIAIDAGTLGTEVLATGAELARCSGAEVALISVADSRSIGVSETSPPAKVTAAILRQEAEGFLAQAAAQVIPTLGHAPLLLVREGLPERELVAAALDWHADVLVMGTHGRTGLVHMFKGSVAEWILHHAPCPVLVVRIGNPVP